MADGESGGHSDWRAPPVVRLAGLWASAMFCYVYGDLIGFYLPGRIEATAAGDLAPLGSATPGALVGIALAMAIPSTMIALSLHLPPAPNRIMNLLLGTVYTLMIATTMLTAPAYYVVLGTIEAVLTASIVWQAWRWPAFQQIAKAEPVVAESAAGRGV